MTGITEEMINAVRDAAVRLHETAGKGIGHGPDHILRVERMALDFLPAGGDRGLCSLVALLHDADDYKLFPENRSGGTPNADRIMASALVPPAGRDLARLEIGRLGYSRRLAGSRPRTMAAMAASDADMCDIMGATGILRLAEYDAAKGVPFFDREDLPDREIARERYMSSQDVGAVRHMFDKVLRLPGLMLTEKGRTEAGIRVRANIAFLRALFREQDAGRWGDMLDKLVRDSCREPADGTEG